MITLFNKPLLLGPTGWGVDYNGPHGKCVRFDCLYAVIAFSRVKLLKLAVHAASLAIKLKSFDSV